MLYSSNILINKLTRTSCWTPFWYLRCLLSMLDYLKQCCVILLHCVSTFIKHLYSMYMCCMKSCIVYPCLYSWYGLSDLHSLTIIFISFNPLQYLKDIKSRYRKLAKFMMEQDLELYYNFHLVNSLVCTVFRAYELHFIDVKFKL